MRGFLFIGAALLASSGVAEAQGYFPFGEIPGLDLKPSVQIDLNPAMLGLVRGAAQGTNPEAANALAGISNVRVYVYENVGDKLSDVRKFIDDTTGKLERDGWHAAVRVNEDDEQVRIFIKTDGTDSTSKISGITIMVTDGSDDSGSDEAVFINIAGEIEAAQLGQIAGALGMQNALSPLGNLGAAGGQTAD